MHDRGVSGGQAEHVVVHEHFPVEPVDRGLLRAVLNTAADDELIRRNPCRIKGADKDEGVERPIATVVEVFLIAEKVRPWYRALVLMAGFTGLRWGELMALTRRDVDLKAATVKVSAAVIELDTLSLGPPKSRAGQRTVAFRASSSGSCNGTSTGMQSAGAGVGCSSDRRGSRHGGRTSTGSGTGRLRLPGWKGCGSTTCATRRTRWQRPGRARRS
jgi:hypothetical protein